MRSHFELFSGILIFMGRAENGYDFLVGRKRNRSGYDGIRTLRRVDDFLCGLIQQLEIIGLQLDSDLLFVCHT